MLLGQQYFSSWEEMGITVPLGKTGIVSMTCPFCSHNRKAQHRNDPCFSIHTEERWYRCHNEGQCGRKGKLSDPNAKKYAKAKTETPADAKNPISEAILREYFERGILQETLKSMGIFTRKDPTGKSEDMIVFPYMFNGVRYNNKYRWSTPDVDKDGNPIQKRRFMMDKDAQLIPYNMDCLATKGRPKPEGEVPYLIITEGEPDLLSWKQVGKEFVVSPPNGATMSDNPDMTWFDCLVDYIENIEVFYLATDDDEPGRKFRDAITSRLGRDKCKLVTYPDGCKDSNDVLKFFGDKELLKCFDEAKWHNINGVSDFNQVRDEVMDIYNNGRKPFAKLHWDLDEYKQWNIGEGFTVISGAPNSAKSDTSLNVIMRLAFMYGVKTAIYATESTSAAKLTILMIQILTGECVDPAGTPMNSFNIPQVEREILSWALDFIEKHIIIISESEEDGFTLESFLDLGAKLKRRHGIKFLVVDPYNKFKDPFGSKGDMMSNSLSDSLTKVQRFIAIHDIHIVIVAHPSKLEGLMTSLYQMNGGAAWLNKLYDGMFQNRLVGTSPPQHFKQGIGDNIKFAIEKVKERNGGHRGEVEMAYHHATGRIGNKGAFDKPVFEDYRDWDCYLGTKPYINSAGQLAWATNGVAISTEQPQPLTPTIVQPPKPIDYFANAKPVQIDITQPGDGDEIVPF